MLVFKVVVVSSGYLEGSGYWSVSEPLYKIGQCFH